MSDDLISRQAALNELHLLAIEALRKQRRDYCAIIDICSNKIKSLPAVQPEQKIGRWITRFDGSLHYCSKCEGARKFLEDYRDKNGLEKEG